MRRSYDEPNSLRAMAPIMRLVLSGPVDQSLADFDRNRRPPAVTKSLDALKPARVHFAATNAAPSAGLGCAFWRAAYFRRRSFGLHACKRRLAAGPAGFPRHRIGSNPCQSAIPAHLLVVIGRYSALPRASDCATVRGLRRRRSLQCSKDRTMTLFAPPAAVALTRAAPFLRCTRLLSTVALM